MAEPTTTDDDLAQLVRDAFWPVMAAKAAERGTHVAALFDSGLLAAMNRGLHAALAALAAAGRLVPVDEETRHVIELRRGGWTIKHPLACRPDLFACLVNRAAERDLTRRPGVLGRHVCYLDGDGGFVIGERIGDLDG